MYRDYSKQQDEIKTIRERTLKLKLSDADVRRLAEKAGAYGLTVSELIENFIGDLVCGTYSNGSDERDYAERWFDRCWFGMFPDNTFLKFLIEWGDVYHALELWDDIQQAKEEIDEIKSHPEDYDEFELPAVQEDMDYWQEQLEEYFVSYQNESSEAVDSSLERGMEKVLEWRKKNFMLMEPVSFASPPL